MLLLKAKVSRYLSPFSEISAEQTVLFKVGFSKTEQAPCVGIATPHEEQWLNPGEGITMEHYCYHNTVFYNFYSNSINGVQ